jgi:type IV pilus assembly protein PilE
MSRTKNDSASTRVPDSGRRPAKGFSLIELMIAVAVVAILAAVAIPSYSAYVVRGKRAEAKAALLQAAQFMERNYSQAGCYAFTDANGCNGLGGVAVGLPGTAATDYSIALAANPQSFVLTATPCGAGGGCAGASTFTDPDCGALTLDNTGAKGALAVSATVTTGTVNPNAAVLAALLQCWQR